MVSTLFTGMGWCCLVLPIVTFAYVQSRGGRHMVPEHLAIVCLVFAGAIFEASLLAFLLITTFIQCVEAQRRASLKPHLHSNCTYL